MSSFKNEIPINAGTAGWIRDCLFLAFFVLSARILWVYLNSVSDLLAWAGFCCILATGVLVWVNTRFVLLAVAASVPLISGIQNSGVMKFAPVIEFCFAAVYVAWYTKNLIQNRGKGRSFTKADLFVDILAGVVIVSLAAQLVVYPFDFLFFRLQQPCVTGLSDRFWCLDSSYILLMGLFYFRLLSMELGQDRSFHRRVRYIIYIQTVIVFMFAGFDFFSRLEGYTLSRIRVALPFGNIHPFGNYVCFLFFFYLGQISFETKQFQLKLRQNSVLMACTLILLALLVLSYSRSTWLAFFIVSGALLFFKLSWKRRIWFVIVISLVFVVIQINGPSFLHSKNRYVKRFARLTVAGHLLEDKTVAGRLMRWKTALEMVGDYPVTGCGIGSFYRLSPHYYTDEEYSDIRSINKGWKKKENVHNYYLQLAAEMGLPGIFFFLAVLFRVYKTGSQRIKEKNNPLDEKKNIKAMLMG